MVYYSVKIAGRSRKTRFKGSRHVVYRKLHELGCQYNKSKAEWSAELKIEPKIKSNVEVIITAYVYKTWTTDTEGNRKHKLELDIVGRIVMEQSRFQTIKNPPDYFKEIIILQLLRNKYSGLATAIRNSVTEEDIKNGLQYTKTSDKPSDFEFVRALISVDGHKKDYTESINEGKSNTAKLKEHQNKINED